MGKQDRPAESVLNVGMGGDGPAVGSPAGAKLELGAELGVSGAGNSAARIGREDGPAEVKQGGAGKPQ